MYLTSQWMYAQNCTVNEYIYVNDINFDITHKFRIDASGALVEVPNPNTNTYPWLPTGVITDPHGISMDRNGFVYISEFGYPTGGMFKLDCDANIIQGNTPYIENANTTNHIIIGDYMYVPDWFRGTQPAGVAVYKICDGNPNKVGYVNVGGTFSGVFTDELWGIAYNPNDGLIYVSDNYAGNIAGQGEIFAIDPSNPESPTSVWQTHATITPVISGLGVPLGITFDDQNNMYVNDNGTLLIPSQPYSRIYKYSFNGTNWVQVAVINDFNKFDGMGWYSNWGIVWSSTSNKLLVTSLNEDCVAVIDPTTMTYLNALSIPHVPGGYAKAINIIKEGCLENNSVINANICTNPSEPILLRDLLNCPVCGGNWNRTSGTGGVFDPCALTFMPDATTTNSTFTLTGSNSECGPYSVTLNLIISDMTLSTNVTCTPNQANIQLNVTNGFPDYEFAWSNGATTKDLTNVTSGSYTVTVTDQTGVCSATTTVTANCLPPLPPATTCCVSPVTPISNNGDFELSTNSNVFNDNIGGFPASGLSSTGTLPGVVGNIAIPDGWTISPGNSAPNPSTQRGQYYINVGNNRFIWIRGGSRCVSSTASFGNLLPCRQYKICVQAAGWSPYDYNPADGFSKMEIDIPFLGTAYTQDIPTTDDITAIQWQSIEFTFNTGSTIDPLSQIALSTGLDDIDGVIYDNFQLCDMGPIDPTATATVTNPTCAGGTAQSNGTITINGFTAGQRYQYSTGSTFNSGSAIPATITAIPVGGVIVNNLPNTTQQYTVRIYDATSNGCYVDRVVSITAAVCGTCDCKDYIYLNEPSANKTHKFRINSDNTLTEINPDWLTGTLNAHSIGMDGNGFVFVGEIGNYSNPSLNNIRKATCDGTLVEDELFLGLSPILTNMVVYDNYIATPDGKLYDICTGALIGQLSYGLTSYYFWDIVEGEDGKIYQPITKNGTLYIYEIPKDPTAYINAVTLTPILTVPGLLSGSLTQFNGMDRDEFGNFYIVASTPSAPPLQTTIIKLSPTGTVLATSSDNINNGSGYYGTWGIRYSSMSGQLYLSSFFEDCIAVLNASDLSYQSTLSVPGAGGKTINIVTECCPTTTPQTTNITLCSGSTGQKIYLNEILPCEGMCADASSTGGWTQTSGNPVVINSCDLSFIPSGDVCFKFVGGGTGVNAQCAPYEVNVCVTFEDPAATVGTVQGTCTGSTPNNDASINITSAVNANQAGISTGSTYSGPVYGGVGTVSITGGAASFTNLMHNTTYTVRIYNGSNECYVDYTVTTPTIACCALTVVCTPQPQTNCTPLNGSASVAASNAVGAVTYIWSTSETTSSISNKMAGTYTVTVTDTGLAGCVRTCSANITNNTVIPTATCSKTDNTSCTTPNGTASVTTTNATNPTYVWSTTPAQTTSSISNLAAGTYTVTVTDQSTGCTNTCEAIIDNATVNPTCSITANSQPSCANLTGGSITVTPSPAGTYSYAWSDSGPNTATRTGLTGGTYTVTVTNTTTNCTGVCNITLTTPTNCCNINAVTIQNVVCNDNSTPGLITDNRLVISATVTNTNASLTSYNATVSGGTTITPNTNIPYGPVQFTLGPGTAGGGATFTVTLTDTATPGCTQTFTVTDPGNCPPATGNCPTPICGSATIQVNGN